MHNRVNKHLHLKKYIDPKYIGGYAVVKENQKYPIFGILAVTLEEAKETLKACILGYNHYIDLPIVNIDTINKQYLPWYYKGLEDKKIR